MLAAQRLGLRRPPRPGLPARQRPLVADAQPPLRPGRPRLRDRLVRQEPVPQQQSRRARQDAGPDLQDQPRERSAREGRPARRSPSERLVELQLHRNDWYVRHARRILQERGPDPKVHARLKAILQTNPDVTRKLRALWALHVTGGLTEQDMIELLVARERVRPELGGAAPRRGQERPRTPRCASSRRWRRATARRWCASTSPARFSACRPRSGGTPSPACCARAEDAKDQNEPLMAWWAAEPLGAAGPAARAHPGRRLEAAADVFVHGAADCRV